MTTRRKLRDPGRSSFEARAQVRGRARLRMTLFEARPAEDAGRAPQDDGERESTVPLESQDMNGCLHVK
jgi:hypothetical protein